MKSEITVEVLCDKDTLFNLLLSNGFRAIARLLIDDYYYTHLANFATASPKELISNSFLIRCLSCNDFKSKAKSILKTQLIYKKKEFDMHEKVISEQKLVTDVKDTSIANEIFQQSGLTNWVTKSSFGYGFKKGEKYIFVQDVEDIGLFIEVEQFPGQQGTKEEILDELVEFMNEINIPVGNNYHESIAYRLHLKRNLKVNFGFCPDIFGARPDFVN